MLAKTLPQRVLSQPLRSTVIPSLRLGVEVATNTARHLLLVLLVGSVQLKNPSTDDRAPSRTTPNVQMPILGLPYHAPR